MPLDPAARGLLDQIEEMGQPPLNELPPSEAREAAKGFAALAGEGEHVSEVYDTAFTGPGGDVPVRVYTPAGVDTSAPLPCLVYYHGGGWVIGDLDGLDAICRATANRGGCKVVSVDYRMAPEAPFPAPLDDSYAALQWVANDAVALGVDPARLAVGGDSAGGNLAAAVALRARDESGPKLRLQVLVYPVTDHKYDTASYQANGEGYLLTTDMMKWFWGHYLPAGTDDSNPYISPLRATDLSNLPPAVVITAEFDPLRDEGEAYAKRLTEAGVEVQARRFDGQIHAFWQMPGVFPAALQAADLVGTALRTAFAAEGASA